MFKYLLMAGVHKLAFVAVFGVTLLEHGDAILVPVFDGSKAFAGLVVLLDKVLLVLLTLVELLLFL